MAKKHGYKQKVADSELACEQAHQYLLIKAKTRWADLSKNFIETDNEGNGILRRRDIKNALYGFDIPLTPREFEKLWQNYDTEGRGYITYQEFLQRLGIRFLPKVHQPYKEDYFNFLGHFTKPKQIQEEIQELQQMTKREKLMDHYEEISKALNMLEKSKTGSAALYKVQNVLQECGCPLKEEELISLLKRLPAVPTPSLPPSPPPSMYVPCCTGLVLLSFSLLLYLLHTVDLEMTSTCCLAGLYFSQKQRDQFGQGLTSPRAQILGSSSPFAPAPAPAPAPGPASYPHSQ